jgi:hypothetical protein
LLLEWKGFPKSGVPQKNLPSFKPEFRNFHSSSVARFAETAKPEAAKTPAPPTPPPPAPEKKSYGNLKDKDRIFTNIYGDRDPFLQGALKRVSISICIVTDSIGRLVQNKTDHQQRCRLDH